MVKRIQLIARQDIPLVAGLLMAVVVIFTRSIQQLMDVARQIEQTYGLALIPALVILTMVFLLHQQSKRQKVKAEAAEAAAEARQAQARAHELEQMVALSQALARALDLESVREALWRHLPALADSRDVWAIIRSSDRWERLIGGTRGKPGLDPALERVADRLAGQPTRAAAEWHYEQGHVCFPLVVGDAMVGVLGVESGRATLDEGARRVLEAAAAMLGVAVKNIQLFQDVREHGLRDGLTGCFNRSHATEALDGEFRRARRSGRPLSVVMFDVDHFKSINDQYGHLCGDAVLAMIGRRMRELLRASDVKCRYGGEEFLVVLPETSLPGARQVAEWLRRELARQALVWNGTRVEVTASFGVAAAHPGDLDPQAIIARADAALYQAKNDGRNCVCVEEDTTYREAWGVEAERPELRLVARSVS